MRKTGRPEIQLHTRSNAPDGCGHVVDECCVSPTPRLRRARMSLSRTSIARAHTAMPVLELLASYSHSGSGQYLEARAVLVAQNLDEESSVQQVPVVPILQAWP